MKKILLLIIISMSLVSCSIFDATGITYTRKGFYLGNETRGLEYMIVYYEGSEDIDVIYLNEVQRKEIYSHPKGTMFEFNTKHIKDKGYNLHELINYRLIEK